jgi:hypothetical protein
MTRATTDLNRAALFQYLFVARKVKGVGGEPHEVDGEVLGILRGAVEYWYPRVNLVPAKAFPSLLPPPEGRRRGTFYQLGEGGLQDTLDGKFSVLMYGVWTDQALYLQLGIMRLGNADDPWRDLRPALWTPPNAVRASPFYLGQLICYAGRVRDLPAAQAEARAVLSVGPGPPYPLREVAIPEAGWMFDCPGLIENLAMFYPDSDATENRADHYFNTVLPELMLNALQVEHPYDRYWLRGFRDRLEEHERVLATVLHNTRGERADSESAIDGDVVAALAKLQNRTRAVAEAYGAFAAQLSTFRQLRHSVGINAENVARCFAEYALPEAGPLGAVRRAVTSNVGQLQADAAYYDTRVQEAEMALRALQGQVAVLQARLEEERNALADQRNKVMEKNVTHIKKVQTFLHLIEYFVVSVYFAHLFHMLIADNESLKHFLHERRLIDAANYGWLTLVVVLLAALAGLGLAFLLDKRQQNRGMHKSESPCDKVTEGDFLCL